MWVLIFITIVVALGAWFVYRFRPQLPDNGGRNESKVEAMELGDVSAATAASNLPKSFPLFGQIRISYSGATSTRSSVLVTHVFERFGRRGEFLRL
ncbi:MAG: hypothetical protein M1275_02790 [Patescibacteria group bacterium]|nr:hypothetical protein [Patescibacteria group bacterium]